MICKYFLALNKDILTNDELEQLVKNVDPSIPVAISAASMILRTLLKQVGHKTLFVVDEHGALFQSDPYTWKITDFDSSDEP